jgi:predicted dehydrogenase
MKPIRVGIIGCGKISDFYLKNLCNHSDVEVLACADLEIDRAKAKAEMYHVPRACTAQELLSDVAIDLVVNLTIPKVHASVCIQALEAGKHVYVEKPLAVTREEGQRILQTAEAKGLRVGCAPDTFLGTGIQTCRQLILNGEIGTPLSAVAFMMIPGHEHWHPDPEFYYHAGGGPMFDMGPYYLTAFVELLGPIQEISGVTATAFQQRTITSKPKSGQTINVEVPTHVTGSLRFVKGPVVTMITSFDIMAGTSPFPNIEIYGSHGTLRVPDPNTFVGPVLLKRIGQDQWEEVPLTAPYEFNSRGIGVVEMANAIHHGRKHRANGELAYHVLEAMHGFHDSSNTGNVYRMHSHYQS